jgi:hypothetical protein
MKEVAMSRWEGVAVSIIVCGAVWAGPEFPIAVGPNQQYWPAISGTLVVWQEMSGTAGTWDIKGADVRDPLHVQPFTVSADVYGNEINPAISGNTVVFQYDSDLLDETMIWMADISQLDRPTVWPLVQTARGIHSYPVVSGDIVAWQDNMGPDWDIIAARVSAGTAYRLPLPMTYEDERFVALEGTLLLWERWSGQGINYIMGCDALDANALAHPLFGADANQWYPAISGHWAVCATDRGIAVDNLADPFIAKPVTGVLADPMTRPSICQNVVVWAQKQGGQYDIYGYNIAQAKQFRITNQAADQILPQVSFSPALGAYVVVWVDLRNGNWDIYGKVLDVKTDVGGCATAIKGDVNEDCKVDALDVAEVQSRIGQINGVPAQ